jgi:hypothetical protein
MTLDVRFPIGMMLATLGVLLAGYGALAASGAASSLGFNVDLIWGIVLLVVGLAMLGLARRAQRAERRA